MLGCYNSNSMAQRTHMDFQSEGKQVIEIERDTLTHLIKKVDQSFDQACQMLLDCSGRIIVIGIGKSGHIGNKIAATFASTGTPAFFVHPAEASHGDLGMITSDDVIVAISHSGNTAELLSLVEPIQNIGAKIIAMTSKPLSPLSKAADINLDIGVPKEACPLGLAPTSSTTATLVMGDALAIALLKARGFTAEQFGLIHPGGTLGRRLQVKVSDIMYDGDELPIVSQTASIREAITEMSEKKLGVTTICDPDGVLLGIFTDGDIRRMLEKNLEIDSTRIEDVMTRQPKSLKPTDQAISAINIMETYKITSLVVLDNDRKLVGIVHMHRLLTTGII